MRKLLFTLLLIVFLPAFAMAANGVTVSYPGAPGPLFTIINMAPGNSVIRTMTVTNDTPTNQVFKFRASSGVPAGMLASKINIRVVSVAASVEKYNNSLSSLFSTGEVTLDSIAPAIPTAYDFIATFDKDAGNEYTGLSEGFDLTVGFDATPTVSPATTSGTSVPMGQLAAFAGFLGFIPDATEVVTTDLPAVEGVSTAEMPKDVKGSTENNTGTNLKKCPWWWIVLLILAAATMVVFYGNYRDDEEPKYWWALPTLLALFAYISHVYLHRGYAETWYCDWFLALDLAVVAVITLIYKYFRNRKIAK